MKFVCLVLTSILATTTFAQDNSKAKSKNKEKVVKVDPEKIIMNAYQKEFVFLNSEKQSLIQQISELKLKSEKEEKSLEKKIDGLQLKVLDLTKSNETLEAKIFAAEEQLDSSVDSSETIENILLQGNESLNSYSALGLDTGKKSETIEDLFSRAQVLLADLNYTRTLEKSYFNKDGKQEKGKVLHYGASIAYLDQGESLNLLAPAGSGKLRVWSNKEGQIVSTEKSADELKHAFLFEGLEKELKSEKAKTMAQIFNSGGLIGAIISFFGALTLIFILMRAFVLQNAAKYSDGVVDEVERKIREGKTEEALAIAEEKASSVARVVAYTIKQLNKTREQIEDGVSEVVLKETLKLDRFSTLIMVTAAIAPLLGLLGTVTGMIATFDIITEVGTGDPKMLSGGISEALVTTMFGLIVAIPCLFFGHLLSGWSERIKGKIEHSALIVINAYEKTMKKASL